MSERTLKIFPALATRQLQEVRQKLRAFVDTPVQTELALEYFSKKADTWIADVQETLKRIFDDDRITTSCLRHLKSPKSKLDELQSALLAPPGVERRLYERAVILANKLKSVSKELEILQGQLVLFPPPARPQTKEERAAEAKERIDQFNGWNTKSFKSNNSALQTLTPQRVLSNDQSGESVREVRPVAPTAPDTLQESTYTAPQGGSREGNGAQSNIQGTHQMKRFQQIAQKVLEEIYELSKTSRLYRGFADLNVDTIAVHINSDPEIVREALHTLKQQGLIKADFDMDGGCAAHITGLGRLQVEEVKMEEMQSAMSNPKNLTGESFARPDPYRHLESALKKFHEDAPAEKSVFVMMKFPSNDMEDWKKKCLSDLYDAVRDELDRHGLVARRADQKTYPDSRQLWDNVCVHMLGCDYGVAILEDHVGDEFNPNVALEYGFMLARGSKVVLLKETNFKHTRADIFATISVPFSISKEHVVDTTSVRNALSDWLSVDLGISPRRKR